MQTTNRITVTVAGFQVEVVRCAEHQFDLYINGIPRLCRNSIAQCMREARKMILKGYGPTKS